MWSQASQTAACRPCWAWWLAAARLQPCWAAHSSPLRSWRLVQPTCFRVQGSGLRVQGSGKAVEGARVMHPLELVHAAGQANILRCVPWIQQPHYPDRLQAFLLYLHGTTECGEGHRERQAWEAVRPPVPAGRQLRSLALVGGSWGAGPGLGAEVLWGLCDRLSWQSHTRVMVACLQPACDGPSPAPSRGCVCLPKVAPPSKDLI